jgi:uncharacterized protein
MGDLITPISERNDSPRMTGLLGLFRRRPVFSALIIFLADAILSLVITQLLGPLVPAGIQGDFFTLIVLVILTVAALTALGWWGEVGFNSPSQWRSLGLLVIPLLMVVVLPLVRGAQSLALGTALYYVAGYALTALHEEVIFRGMILRILGPAGRTRAIWMSALLFGLAHAANLFVRSNPFLVLAQMVGAGTGGVGMAALRFKTNTIWTVMALHFFEDLLLHYTNLPAIPVNVAQSVVLFFVGLYILWKYRHDEKATGVEQAHRV